MKMTELFSMNIGEDDTLPYTEPMVQVFTLYPQFMRPDNKRHRLQTNIHMNIVGDTTIQTELFSMKHSGGGEDDTLPYTEPHGSSVYALLHSSCATDNTSRHRLQTELFSMKHSGGGEDDTLPYTEPHGSSVYALLHSSCATDNTSRHRLQTELFSMKHSGGGEDDTLPYTEPHGSSVYALLHSSCATDNIDIGYRPNYSA
ncbi:hypothetical protein J6590_067727 [Homalodisca vitripennis]|nr:hypothetical protein J6590_067727 [Homalodisca vitripennis]